MLSFLINLYYFCNVTIRCIYILCICIKLANFFLVIINLTLLINCGNNIICLGKVSLSWSATRPKLIVGDSELIRLILSDKKGHFVKPPQNPLVNLLQLGVSNLDGEKWSKRRRLMTPAFHLEKLKVLPIIF